MKETKDWGSIPFGYTPLKSRYEAVYKDGQWVENGLVGEAEITLSESAVVFQYAQTCFEGLKAYRTEAGHIVIFRPDLNAKRFSDSCRRMFIPEISPEMFIRAIDMTARANEDSVPPYGSGATLYIRPFAMGTSAALGVKPADEYIFRVFGSPVGAYFKGGVKPITLTVSDYDRAAPHGTGDIKAGLNYAMSLYPGQLAHAAGFAENLYLDPATRTKVEEREVLFSEVPDFAECGLCGTAAVISPVGAINDHGRLISFPSGMEKPGPVCQKLYDTLTGIQMGRIAPPEGWLHTVL